MEKDNFYFQQLDYLSVYPFELQQMSMINPQINLPQINPHYYNIFPQQFMPQFVYSPQYNPQYHFFPAPFEYPYQYPIDYITNENVPENVQKPPPQIYTKLLLDSWSFEGFSKVPSCKVLQSFYNKPNVIISRST